MGNILSYESFSVAYVSSTTLHITTKNNNNNNNKKPLHSFPRFVEMQILQILQKQVAATFFLVKICEI
jgi:hypothetical protein